MAITRATAAAAAAACFLGTLTPPTAGLQGDWRPGLHLSRTKTALQECPFNLAACAFMDLPDAPQYVYQRGVPHTDRHGNRRTVYSEEESFLPQVKHCASSSPTHRSGRRSTDPPSPCPCPCAEPSCPLDTH